MNKQSGFTIVELLVVIVVIGVLAAISLVSYSGISARATVASIQSDLDTNGRLLKMYYTEYGSYPTNTLTDVSKCPINPNSDTRYCLKLSGANSVDYYSGTSTGFTLRIKNGTRTFVITDNSTPGEVAPLTAIGGVGGATLIGSSLTAGALSPFGATATYSWKVCTDNTDTNTCSDLGNSSETYVVSASNVNKYIRVVATGSGSYYGSLTSAPTQPISPWYPGLSSTVLSGKSVYYQDVGTYTWGPSSACPQGTSGSQPCQVGLDPSYASSAVLVSPQLYPSIDFTSYPAQKACRDIGGRLPNAQELSAIYAGRASYGNNFSHYYWAATEADANNARVHFPGVEMTSSAIKTQTGYWVKCVKD